MAPNSVEQHNRVEVARGRIVPLRRPVVRDKLVARLRRADGATTIVVVAPAGQGKGSLLTEWCAWTEGRAAWVTVGPADKDPLRFWRRVIDTVEGIQPGIGDGAAALVRTLQAPSLDRVVEAVIDALTRTPHELALVLDDLHLFDSAEVFDTLERFTAEMPPTERLVIFSRGEPPLKLARMRARGELLRLRAGDPRFDEREARALFTACSGVDLSDRQMAALVARTDGWAGRAPTGSMVAGSRQRARLALLRGDQVAAGNWIRERGLTIHYDFLPGDELHYATFGRWLIREGRLEEAASLVARCLADAERGGRMGRALVFRVLLAEIDDAGGRHDDAIRGLAEALEFAAHEGFVRPFLDAEPTMPRLLREAMRMLHREAAGSSELAIDHARIVLTAWDRSIGPRERFEAAVDIVEPLTERELEIVRLLADGRSNPQIAEQLYLAPGTVKAHLSHIYGKLWVRNRTEAVAAARRLGVVAE